MSSSIPKPSEIDTDNIVRPYLNQIAVIVWVEGSWSAFSPDWTGSEEVCGGAQTRDKTTIPLPILRWKQGNVTEIKDVAFDPAQPKVKDNVSKQYPLESEFPNMLHGGVSATVHNKYESYIENIDKLFNTRLRWFLIGKVHDFTSDTSKAKVDIVSISYGRSQPHVTPSKPSGTLSLLQPLYNMLLYYFEGLQSACLLFSLPLTKILSMVILCHHIMQVWNTARCLILAVHCSILHTCCQTELTTTYTTHESDSYIINLPSLKDEMMEIFSNTFGNKESEVRICHIKDHAMIILHIL